jgi:hypothetical protein
MTSEEAPVMTDKTAQSTMAHALVIKDQAGDYFLLPKELIERSRVPDEHKAEIERLASESEEVTGYFTALYNLAVRFFDSQIENALIQMIVNAPDHPAGARTDAAR